MSEQGTNQIQQLQVPPAQDFDTANFQGSMQEVLHENIGNYVMSADQPKKHCDTRQSRQSVL